MMIIHLQIDTDKPLSDKDLALLYQLIGLNTPDERDADESVQEATPEPESEPEVTREPEPDPDELRSKALEAAASLLADGQREKVTNALRVVGATRVSEVPVEELARFAELLHAKEER